MKKILSMIMISSLLLSMTACGGQGNSSSQTNSSSQNIEIEANTIATKLQVSFLNHAQDAKNKEALAKTMMEECSDMITFDYDVYEIQEGFLNGFQSDITGFSSGVCFCPFISSIPFVGYIFETDDAETLKKALEAEHQLDWNICTTADEIVIEQVGNLVLCVMAPESMEE